MSARSGIEIDYCPECRGVWLDRGELDKILDREQQHQEGPSLRDRDRGRDADYDRTRDQYYAQGSQRQYRKKRGGFLGELFEGFGD